MRARLRSPYRGVTAWPTRNLGHAFWTTPLATDAPIASTSTSMVSRLAAQAAMAPGGSPLAASYGPPYNTDTSVGGYSIPVYRVPIDQPRVPVWSRADKVIISGDARTVDLRAQLSAGVPIPNPAYINDGFVGASGTDGSAIIICGYTAWEMWQIAPATPGVDPAGYAWRCQQGGVIADIRTHPGWWSASPYFGGGSGGRNVGADWGVSATGMSYLSVMLKSEDWTATDILHPLGLALPITGGAGSEPNLLLPATRFDKQNLTPNSDTTADPYRVPEGARFRLPVSFDMTGWVSAHAVSTTGQNGANAATLAKVLRCLRDFGVIINDSAGIIGFSAEATKTYGTPYSATAASQAPAWGNFGQQLPWSSLVQVAPPTTDTSIPGAA